MHQAQEYSSPRQLRLFPRPSTSFSGLWRQISGSLLAFFAPLVVDAAAELSSADASLVEIGAGRFVVAAMRSVVEAGSNEHRL